MRSRLALVLFVAIVACVCPSLSASEKPRVVVLTDIENEPDDAMSVVRFLTYTNQWDVKGLVATTSVHQKDKIAAWRIREIVEAYGKVRDNLEAIQKRALAEGLPYQTLISSLLKKYASGRLREV